MENVLQLLEFVRKTNPTMTLEKLMKELSSTSNYGIVALKFSIKN